MAPTGYIENGWQVGPEGLYSYLNDSEIVFQNNEDGTFSLTTSAPNPFLGGSGNEVNSPYTVLNDNIYFYLDSNLSGSIVSYSISKNSSTRLVLESITTIYSGVTETLACNRTDIPPANPTSLRATISNATVSLSWTDASSDESGFKLLRRDSLESEFEEIGTASANATAYTDILPSDGKYWYRIVAYNNNGDSLGSNVVKITKGDDSQALIQELRMLRERVQILEEEIGGTP